MPKRIVINGGGYIALEFAGIFAGLGADTTVVYRGDKILRGFDEDLRDALTEEYGHRGIRLVTRATFEKIDKTDTELSAQLSDGTRLEADQIMFATGRAPNVDGLGLQAAGVELGWNGQVVVDAGLKTSVDSIFAVGDVCDRTNLTPVAIREGHSFADSIYGGNPWSVDHELIPTAVFSNPEIATVGMPEDIARERCRDIDIYKARFRPLKNTLSGRQDRTLMKLIVDADTDKVVGCHMLGPDAAEIIQAIAIAMRMGATKAQFDATMALHPSVAEELVTMRTKWQPATN